jgi:TPR repeat protein
MKNVRWSKNAVMAALALTLSAPSWADYAAGMDALAVKDYARARREFETETANAQAAYQLARMAQLGLGEPRNPARRAGLLQRSAELGFARAKFEYALALGNGTGVTAEPARALKMLEELDAANQLDATVYLGRLYRYGWWGVAKDDVRGTALMRKASEAGSVYASVLYASALIQGAGVAADAPRGTAMLKELSERGNVDAQLEYARFLTFGLSGVPKDEAAGTALYRKVADLGDATAQYGVCLAFLNGRGVPRDEAAAARWCDAAARQGDEWSQLRLGDMYRAGQGVPKLRGSAYYWYTLAARSPGTAGEQARDRRATLAREMTGADIENQVKRAALFEQQPGFKPRLEALPMLARGDRVTLGPTSIVIPTPSGYMNNADFVEYLQKASPNDPDLYPRLMVLSHQEDMNRVKLGMPGLLRSVEISRHLADDVVVTQALFADIRKQMRANVQATQAAGRVKVDMVRDDDTVFAFTRASQTGDNRANATALVLVGERVLAMTFSGFDADHLPELRDLVGGSTKETLARNGRGAANLFGSNGQ